MGSSLVIQTSFLGDTVLTTPLLAELARRGPVDVVTTPASAAILANHPAVRSVIPYDKRATDRGTAGFLRLTRQLRRVGYESAYLAQGSVRSAALALVAGVPRRVGFSTSPGRFLYTQRVQFRRELHHAARLLRLAKPEAEASGTEIRPRLYPGIPERGAVDRLLALHDALNDAPLVAIAPGSVWATKRWPFYADLARDLAPRARIVVLGSAGDADIAREVCAAADEPTDRKGPAINAAGVLTLLGSAELIRRCQVLVTNDSAPQHLASAMNTPTITIFGPTVPTMGFGPLARHSAVVGHEALTCRPCDPHGPVRCPLGHWRCMREVGPRDVTSRVDDILSA